MDLSSWQETEWVILREDIYYRSGTINRIKHLFDQLRRCECGDQAQGRYLKTSYMREIFSSKGGWPCPEETASFLRLTAKTVSPG